MRIGVNLASEPFRRDRPVYFTAAVLALVLLTSLGFLIYLTLQQRAVAASSRDELARLQTQWQQLNTEDAQLQTVMRKPENAEVLERSVFLNSLILPKSVSWTRMFADLEAVMPPDVRLISIRPQVTSQHDVVLDMAAGSENVDSVRTMLMKLEGSPLFGEANVLSQFPPSQTEPLFRYRLTVNYRQRL